MAIRKPLRPPCAYCSARHREPFEYTACERTHAAAQEITHRQLEEARGDATIPLPSDVLDKLAHDEAKKIWRAQQYEQGIITSDTLPAVTHEVLRARHGERDEENWPGAWDHLIDNPDVFCWYNSRMYRRDGPQLARVLKGSVRSGF